MCSYNYFVGLDLDFAGMSVKFLLRMGRVSMLVFRVAHEDFMFIFESLVICLPSDLGPGTGLLIMDEERSENQGATRFALSGGSLTTKHFLLR